jgi:hypothetical protein
VRYSESHPAPQREVVTLEIASCAALCDATIGNMSDYPSRLDDPARVFCGKRWQFQPDCLHRRPLPFFRLYLLLPDVPRRQLTLRCLPPRQQHLRQRARRNPQSAPVIAPSTSSLEVFQRGESTATPASSPLKEVYFDFDRYDLRADARETLKANGDWLKANPSVVVEIEGHCDEQELITITCHDRPRITLGHRQV